MQNLPEISDDAESDVKAIGKPFRRLLGLGRGRSKRPGKRSSNLPIDGDGDGFYSAFPGAPDETPMPPEPAMSRNMATQRGNIYDFDPTSRLLGRFGPSESAEGLLGKEPSLEQRELLDAIDSATGSMSLVSGGNTVQAYPKEGARFFFKQLFQKNPVHKSLENLEKMRSSVFRKYGPLRTNGDCYDALEQAFPNAKVLIQGVRGPRAKRDAIASENVRGLAVGLLTMAEIDPESAAYLRQISDYRDSDGKWKPEVLGSTRFGSGVNGYGATIAFNFGAMEEEKISLGREYQNLFDNLQDVTWDAENYAKYMLFRRYALKVREVQKNPDFSPEEKTEEIEVLKDELIQDLSYVRGAAVAIHEFGHLMHYSQMMKYLNVESDHDTLQLLNGVLDKDFQSEEQALLWIKNQNLSVGDTRTDFLQRLTDLYSKKSKRQTPQARTFFKRLKDGPPISELDAALFLKSHAASIIQKKFDSVKRNGLTEEDAKKSVEQAKTFSRYGGSDLWEAVAEWVTFRVLTGQYVDGEGHSLDFPKSKLVDQTRTLDSDKVYEMDKFLEWATRGKIKQASVEEDRLAPSFQMCTGELDEDLGIASDPKRAKKYREEGVVEEVSGKRKIVSKALILELGAEVKGRRRRVGRALGATPGLGVLRGNEPIDGDGDGKYTPFPGAGDDTPMPPRPPVVYAKRPVGNPEDLRLGVGRPLPAGEGIFRNNPLQRIAKHREAIRRKYKNIETNSQMVKALKKTFPNLSNIDPALLPDDDEKISPWVKNVLSALLASALMDPVFVNWLTDLKKNNNKPAVGGTAAIAVNALRENIGLHVSFKAGNGDYFLDEINLFEQGLREVFGVDPDEESLGYWRALKNLSFEARMNFYDQMFSNSVGQRAIVQAARTDPDLKKWFSEAHLVDSPKDAFKYEKGSIVEQKIREIYAWWLGMHESSHLRNFARTLNHFNVPELNEEQSIADVIPLFDVLTSEIETVAEMITDVFDSIEAKKYTSGLSAEDRMLLIRLGLTSELVDFVEKNDLTESQENWIFWVMLFNAMATIDAQNAPSGDRLATWAVDGFDEDEIRRQVTEEYKKADGGTLLSRYGETMLVEMVAEALAALALGGTLDKFFADLGVVKWAATGKKSLSGMDEAKSILRKIRIKNNPPGSKPKNNVGFPSIELTLCFPPDGDDSFDPIKVENFNREAFDKWVSQLKDEKS